MHDLVIPDIQINTWIYNPELGGVKKFLYVKQTGYPGPNDGMENYQDQSIKANY